MGAEAIPQTIIKVAKLAHECIKIRLKIADLSKQNWDMKDELLQPCAEGCTLRSQFEIAERSFIDLKRQLADAKVALWMMASKTF